MDSENSEKSVQMKMFYDPYEKDFGDGFYPYLHVLRINIKDIKEIIITFKTVLYNRDLSWIQNTGSVIYGLDGNVGEELLFRLNKECDINAKNILNCGGRVIYPYTRNSTFKILDNV